jgi:hydrogenase-4 component B
MQPCQTIVAAAGLLAVGSLVTAVASRKRDLCAYLALAFVTGAGALALWGALVALVGPADVRHEITLATVGALHASLSLAVDRLSALFLMIVSVVAFLATLYSTAYMRSYSRQHLARYYPILLLFFGGIIGVVTVRDWFFFVLFWEFMTVCSYFLVIYEEENPASLRAGFKYLVITHVATVCIFIAAIVLWHTAAPHSFSFASCGAAMAALAQSRPVVLHVLLALWLIGFATKAGILPFGDWLPDAYPAAPTGATAAFAGTMTKLGIYGLLRVFVDLLPVSEFSVVWGVVIALLGTGSIFVGTLTALQQDNAKRLMSFHVIGQMGYIFLAIGMGMFFLPTNPKLALTGLMAGLFHLINNVIYKSLLFFTAGSLRYRTGEENLNHMGGLSTALPVTALMAGIGSLAIAGIPPFNGFASKWLIYEVAIMGGIGFPLFLLFGVTAIFISLVTLASFLKYLGATFLGQPSRHVSHLVGKRHDVPVQMQVPQVALALCCLAFGLFPLLPLGLIFRAVSPLTSALANVSLTSALGSSPVGLSFMPDGAAAGVWSPIVASTALTLCVALCYGLARAAQPATRRVPVWYGGEEVTAEIGHFHSHGMYEPFRRAFEKVYVMTGVPRAGYPVSLARVFDVDIWLYDPLVRAGGKVAERFSRSHVGIPQWYLMWQVVGVVVVLATLFLLLR